MRQKDEVLLFTIGVAREGVDWPLADATALTPRLCLRATSGPRSARSCCLLMRFCSRSRALLSSFRFFRSSTSPSMGLYGLTPLSKLVNTSRGGRGSKSPARTEVAVRRRLHGREKMEGATKAVTMDEWRAGDKLEKVRDKGQEESGSRGWSIRWVYKSGWVELVKCMGKTAPNKRTTIQQQDPEPDL